MNWNEFTPAEQRVLYYMGEVQEDNMISNSIHIVMNSNPSTERLRSAMCDLISMCLANPLAVARMTSFELVDAVMSIAPEPTLVNS